MVRGWERKIGWRGCWGEGVGFGEVGFWVVVCWRWEWVGLSHVLIMEIDSTATIVMYIRTGVHTHSHKYAVPTKVR